MPWHYQYLDYLLLYSEGSTPVYNIYLGNEIITLILFIILLSMLSYCLYFSDWFYELCISHPCPYAVEILAPRVKFKLTS